MTAPIINGSWFEFQHCFEVEGWRWNRVFRHFTHEQWAELLGEMAAAGMEYIVLMGSAIANQTFYASRHFESYDRLDHPNPLPAVLAAADKLQLKIFVANDFFGDWRNPEAMFTDPAVMKLRQTATAELAEMFAAHSSFYGWYLPNEASIFPYFSERFIDYVNGESALIRQLTPGKPILVAPFGTFRSKPDKVFCRQLERLDADIVAYQDEIGVRKANVDWTPYFFEQLRLAHDQVGRSAIWADVEAFRFAGKVYQSALVPAPFERLQTQLEAVAPFVDNILIYQYPGLLARPGSTVSPFGAAAERLYTRYMAYRKALIG